jgi:hypothetical protein
MWCSTTTDDAVGFVQETSNLTSVWKLLTMPAMNVLSRPCNRTLTTAPTTTPINIPVVIRGYLGSSAEEIGESDDEFTVSVPLTIPFLKIR